MGAKLDSGVGEKRGRPPINAEPNVIPFIDVMLVLLIIFMVAAPIATVDIKVQLPYSKTTSSKRPPKPTWVSLKDDGTQIGVFVMNEETSFDGLGAAVTEAVAANDADRSKTIEELRETRIYVRADAGTKYKHVMRIMNRLQDAGFTKIALVAEDRRR